MFLRELAYILVILLTMAAYFVYKRKQPDRAKENRPYFVLGSILFCLLIALLYDFLIPNSGGSFLAAMSLSGYIAYRVVLLVPEKFRAYLISLISAGMFSLLLYGFYFNFSVYKHVTQIPPCPRNQTELGSIVTSTTDFHRILNIPDRPRCRDRETGEIRQL